MSIINTQDSVTTTLTETSTNITVTGNGSSLIFNSADRRRGAVVAVFLPGASGRKRTFFESSVFPVGVRAVVTLNEHDSSQRLFLGSKINSNY